MADCQLRIQAHYGHDAVFAFMDFGLESGGHRLPPALLRGAVSGDHRLRAAARADAGQLRLPDRLPTAPARTLARHRAPAFRPRRYDAGRRQPARADEPGHPALRHGSRPFLAADDPGRFEIALDYATACAIRYGQAQIAAGAHLPVVFDPAACRPWCCGLFPRTVAAPAATPVRCPAPGRGRRQLAQHRQTDRPILPWYPAAGADIATFDYYVSPGAGGRPVAADLPARQPPSLDFLDAHPQRIAAAAHLALAAFRERGGFILSSGCEIPPESAPANIAALIAARDGE